LLSQILRIYEQFLIYFIYKDEMLEKYDERAKYHDEGA
jgi:hypothetical protein